MSLAGCAAVSKLKNKPTVSRATGASTPLESAEHGVTRHILTHTSYAPYRYTTRAPRGAARLAQKKGFPLMPMSSTSNSRVAPGGMSGGAPRWPSAVQDNDKRYLGAGGWAECTAGRAWFDVLARTCEVGRACESRLLALAHLQHALRRGPAGVSARECG